MPTTLEKVDSNTVRLHVEIPAEDIEGAFAKELRKRREHVHLKGFRPGKAPLSLLKGYIGGEVMAEVTGEMMQRSVVRAVEENSLILAAPAKIALGDRKPGESFRFSATLEVHEKPRDVDLAGLKAVRRVPEVDEAAVTEQILHLREVHAQSVPIDPPRPSRKGDIARIDYSIRFDDKPGAPPVVREGVEVEVGAPYFLLDRMGETLEEMPVGSEKTAPVSFPDDFLVGSLAGRAGQVTVKLKDLSERRLPAVDDEFARDLGVENIEALRVKVRAELEDEAKAFADQEVDRVLLDAVVERAAPSLPPTWIEERLREHEEAFKRLMGGGPEMPEAERGLLRQEAERRLRQAVVIGWIAKQQDLRGSEADVQERLARIAESTGRPLAQVRAELARHGTDSLESEITEEKVLAAIRAAATIEDGPPLPASERKGRKRSVRAPGAGSG